MKTGKIRRIYFLVCCACVFSLYAQEAEVSQSIPEEATDHTAFQANPNALGFYICYPTTGGITYHRWIKRFGIGITAGGIVTRGGGADYNVQLSLDGIVYQKDVTSWFSTAFYTHVLLGHRGSRNSSYATADPEYGKFVPAFHLGFGIGTELLFAKHLSLNVDCMIVGIYPWELGMGAGGGLKFRF